MRIGLLGSTGVVGHAVAGLLTERRVEWARIDVRGAGEALAQFQVAVLATGGDLEATRTVATAALAAGVHVVDVDREVGHLDWLHRTGAERGRDTGAHAVGAAGVRFAMGDLLASLAAELVAQPRALHAAYTAGGRPNRLTPGERRAAVAALGRSGTALVDGRRVEEHPGEARRLAWFPRPVGPAHAAAVPGGEALTVPLHVPELTTIRTYESLSGWRAELLQARANLARTTRGRRLLARRLQAGRGTVGPATRSGQRWGCVAEVAAEGSLGRAWAYGYDPVGVTAAVATELALHLAAVVPVPGSGGARAPSQITDPGELLDTVAEVTDLRWSRTPVDLAQR